MKAGILGYGVYVPTYRIKAEEFAKAWGYFTAPGVKEKAVCGSDEDSLTMAMEASLNCLEATKIEGNHVDALLLASTSLPYEETTMSVTLANVIDAPTETRTIDFKDSTKSSAGAMLCAFDFITSRKGGLALVASSDSPLAGPGSARDHPLGAGAAAYLVGEDAGIAQIEGYFSAQAEFLGTRFRRRGESEINSTNITKYERLGYINTVSSAAHGLLKKLGLTFNDFEYVVPHQTDARLPYRAARELGIEAKKTVIIADLLGDVASASIMLGLSLALEKAKPEDRIMLLSYGSGSGSDAISLLVTDEIDKIKSRAKTLTKYLNKKAYIDYVTYLKFRGMIA